MPRQTKTVTTRGGGGGGGERRFGSGDEALGYTESKNCATGRLQK